MIKPKNLPKKPPKPPKNLRDGIVHSESKKSEAQGGHVTFSSSHY